MREDTSEREKNEHGALQQSLLLSIAGLAGSSQEDLHYIGGGSKAEPMTVKIPGNVTSPPLLVTSYTSRFHETTPKSGFTPSLNPLCQPVGIRAPFPGQHELLGPYPPSRRGSLTTRLVCCR